MDNIDKRHGNCFDRANILAKFLWENSVGIHRIEIVSTKTFEHYFVIVNRKDLSDLKDSSTWGDAWIVDAWFGDNGAIFPASKFKEYITGIKEFAKIQDEARTQLNSLREYISDTEETLDKCICEIRPLVDKYPTYSLSPFYPIQYYYSVDNYTKDNSVSRILKCLEEHKTNLKKGLSDINQRKYKLRDSYKPTPATASTSNSQNSSNSFSGSSISSTSSSSNPSDSSSSSSSATLPPRPKK